jgi:hypothetical protein
MAVFPRPARPRALIADVKRLWNSGTRRYKLVFGALAIGMTSIMVTLFILESRWGVLPEGPQIIYASDWPADRTDAQIKAQQKIDQAVLDKARAERRREFQKLDDALKRSGL